MKGWGWRILERPSAAGCEGMGMEGSAGGPLLSVSCEGMEGVDGGRGSRVGVCGGMGMVDFSAPSAPCGWMGMVDFSRLDVMPRCGLDGANFNCFSAPSAPCGGMEMEDWLVFRL